MATLTGIGWNVHNKTYASGYESNSLLGRGNWVRIDSSLQSASQIATQIKGWAVAGFGIMLLLAQEGGSVTSDNVVGKVRDIAIACSSLGYYPDVLEVYNEANTSGANAVTYSRVVADCTRIRAFAYQFLPNKPLIYAGSMASYDVRAGWDVELWSRR